MADCRGYDVPGMCSGTAFSLEYDAMFNHTYVPSRVWFDITPESRCSQIPSEAPNPTRLFVDHLVEKVDQFAHVRQPSHMRPLLLGKQ